MRVAAIDLGTNSFHLLVADIDADGQPTVVEKARSQVMLGSGGLGQSRIADDAFARGLEALQGFKAVCDSLEVDDIHAAATSAVREASNGSEFCHVVKAETGIHVRVISGIDEARLIYLGARQSLDFTHGRVMLLDLGGGSTELILAEPERMVGGWSLPLGHIRLADRFHHSDPITEGERRQLRRHVREVLGPLGKRVPKGTVGSLVGTSGTIRCLARIAHAARGETVLEHGHGLVLRRSEVEAFLRLCMTTSEADLIQVPGIDPKRTRTLPSGAAVVREVMKMLGTPTLSTSELSLRDGLLVDWLQRHRPEIDLQRTVRDPRRRSVMLAMQRFGVDEAHADHVMKLATQLFDATARVHELPISDRELLEHAARLHDIGHHIAGKGHHKHGQYLLKHIRMPGFNATEVAILANIVRYHSRSRPKSTHPDFAALATADQRRVRVLTALVKVADALDRSHNQPIKRLDVQLTPTRLTLTGWCDEGGGELERWEANQRTSLLVDVLGRAVEIVIQTPADDA